nr:type II toxin-antitoxin system HicB family antitoxin [uncultured Carboxylicivirga sp.]
MKKVIFRVDKLKNNFAVSVDGLDGFVFTADTLEELRKEVKEGIKFHLDGMDEE